MSRLFYIVDIPSWCVRIRSKFRIKKNKSTFAHHCASFHTIRCIDVFFIKIYSYLIRDSLFAFYSDNFFVSLTHSIFFIWTINKAPRSLPFSAFISHKPSINCFSIFYISCECYNICSAYLFFTKNSFLISINSNNRVIIKSNS